MSHHDHPWRQAFRLSLSAAKENLLPCLGGQTIIAIFVFAYFFYPPTVTLLEALAHFRSAGGLAASFVMTGFAGGLLAEVLRVYTLQKGKWKRKNVSDALFLFVVIGIGGMGADRLYAIQNALFGTEPDPLTILKKVILDQFFYAPLIIAPYMAAVFEWRDAGFSFSKLWQQRKGIYARRVIPFLITNWSFWIPMTILIYSMPTLLQIPILVFITAIWGSVLLSLDHLTRQKLHATVEIRG
ncbi:MAG: hypothetical protein NZM04_04440 [Methylacidiphilales bacterium]|nr:hypothetical protein [Candidatus Methylacidiphilales bacterium]MDW8349925.1 hypothetical protein [Verrucomicrobiae bacterium]